jgi:hypothetical protein
MGEAICTRCLARQLRQGKVAPVETSCMNKGTTSMKAMVARTHKHRQA